MILWWCFLLKLAKNISAFEERVKLVNPRITARGLQNRHSWFYKLPLHAGRHVKKNKEREEKMMMISKYGMVALDRTPRLLEN